MAEDPELGRYYIDSRVGRWIHQAPRQDSGDHAYDSSRTKKVLGPWGRGARSDGVRHVKRIESRHDLKGWNSMDISFDLDHDSNTSVLVCISVWERAPELAREMMLDKMSRAFGEPIIWNDIPEHNVGTPFGHRTFWAQVRVLIPEHEADLKRLRMLDGRLLSAAAALSMEDDREFCRRNPKVGRASERWSRAMIRSVRDSINETSQRVIASIRSRIDACQ